jgi:hypothetical protein
VKTYTLRNGSPLRFLLLTTLVCGAAALPLWAVPRADILQAIHWVENPRNVTKPGPGGELGAYQFRESTWRMHTKLPFRYALEQAHAEPVALRHYDWIARGLVRNGMEVTPYNVALAWNGGLSATVRGRVPVAAHRYAERVQNLAGELSGQRLVKLD